MSAGWQAIFWLLALLVFMVDAVGIVVTYRGTSVKLQSLGLVLFTVPWLWTAAEIAT